MPEPEPLPENNRPSLRLSMISPSPRNRPTVNPTPKPRYGPGFGSIPQPGLIQPPKGPLERIMEYGSNNSSIDSNSA